MAKICITGDSWGAGVWDNFDKKDPKSYGIIHKGLEHFLKQNHTVINVSLGGSSNIQAIKRLTRILQKQQFDYIFWFITDPLRDKDRSWFNKSGITYNELLQETNNLEEESYKLAYSLNHVIHCIGGAHKINLELIRKYSSLNPHIISFTEFLLPKYQHPEIWSSKGWLTEIANYADLETLNKIIKNRDKQIELFNYKDLFWPDGNHPNIKAHEILYNKICADFRL